MTPEQFARAGRLLCGEHWKQQLAGLLGMGHVQMMRYERGTTPIPTRVKSIIKRLIGVRVIALQAIDVELDDAP